MTQKEFLKSLKRELKPLGKEGRADSIEYYRELIEDKKEEGCEDAISTLGDPKEIAAGILAEAGIKPSEKKPFSTALIIMGSPVWLALLAAGGAVVLVVYAAIWVVVVSLIAAAAALLLCGVAGVMGCVLTISENPAGAFLLLGAGFLLSGVGLALGVGMLFAAKELAKSTGKAFNAITGAISGRLKTA